MTDDEKAQGDRIGQKAADMAEAFLDGRASLEIRPLSADGGVAVNVGGEKGVSVVNGFSIRLVKDA